MNRGSPMKANSKTPVTRGLLMLVAALAITSAWAQAKESPMSVRIEAQPLDAALNAWAAQTGYSVLVPFERAAQGKMAPRVEGYYTPEAALKILLTDSGLREHWINK